MEGPPQIERFPTKEEVLFEIGKYCENPKIKRELYDSKGSLFILEVETEVGGEVVEYTYQREGELGKNKSGATDIHKLRFTDGIPVSSDHIATYDSQTKKWSKIE